MMVIPTSVYSERISVDVLVPLRCSPRFTVSTVSTQQCLRFGYDWATLMERAMIVGRLGA